MSPTDVETSSSSARSRWLLFAVWVVLASLGAGYLLRGVYGPLGIRALLAGLAFGGLTVGLGKLSVWRQARATQAQLLRRTMLASFVGIFAFLIGTVVAAKLWKEGYRPTVLVALALYMSYKAFEVWIVVAPPGGARSTVASKEDPGSGDASRES